MRPTSCVMPTWQRVEPLALRHARRRRACKQDSLPLYMQSMQRMSHPAFLMRPISLPEVDLLPRLDGRATPTNYPNNVVEI